MKPRHRRYAERGFTLIEALIALLVLSFGMLALAGMQATLSYAGDVSKQRTEAMRLAQERLEQMRSYTGLASGAINWQGIGALPAGSATSNTTYTVSSAMSGTAADTSRAARASVSWVDRSGVTQTLTMSSVIARSDPADAAFILTPMPGNTNRVRRPFDRALDIPTRALDLGNGTSSYQLSANYVLIFNNTSAGVVQICNPGVSNATAAQILASSCTSITASIVSGYITRDSNEPWPTGMNIASIVRTDAGSQPIHCDLTDAVSQVTGAVLDSKFYICVVPLAPPAGGGEPSWGGTLRLGGIGTTARNVVCRYQLTNTRYNANSRNVQPYSNVQATLDNQNYLLATVSNSTNTPNSVAGSTTLCPSEMTVPGVSQGVVHQDCRSANLNRATECPTASP